MHIFQRSVVTQNLKILV